MHFRMSVSLTARIALIVYIGLSVLWVGVIAFLYVQQDNNGGGVLPPPQQLAAIIDALERAPPDLRPAVLAAVTSDTFSATLRTGQVAGETAPLPSHLFKERSFEVYQQALGRHPLSIEVVHSARLLEQLRWFFPTRLRFTVGMVANQMLVVETHSLLPITFWGMPRGLGSGLFGTLIAFVALYIMHRETGPLVRLAAAVDRVDLASEPVILAENESAAPEIRALIGAFNRLQTRLSDLLKARMAMLGGISHDVRTFATRLSLRASLIPDGENRTRIETDIVDMIRLLDDALLASRAEFSAAGEELLNMTELVGDECAEKERLGARVRFCCTGEEVLILGDKLATRRIVANLLENALKYAGRAEVRVEREDGFGVLIVDDDGPGIAPSQRNMLLEPFVRLETSRNRGTGGAGLGLAIVRTLAEACGGSVEIGDAPIGGARFMVRLPLFVDLSQTEAAATEA